jgi:hypothetical protein
MLAETKTPFYNEFQAFTVVNYWCYSVSGLLLHVDMGDVLEVYAASPPHPPKTFATSPKTTNVTTKE